MAKIFGILNNKKVYDKECCEQELFAYCSNIINKFGVDVIIQMFDDNDNIVDGTEEWLE